MLGLKWQRLNYKMEIFVLGYGDSDNSAVINSLLTLSQDKAVSSCSLL